MADRFTDLKERLGELYSNEKAKRVVCGVLAFGTVLSCGLAALYYPRPKVSAPVCTLTPTAIITPIPTLVTKLTPTPTSTSTPIQTPTPSSQPVMVEEVEYHVGCNDEKGLILEVDVLGRGFEGYTLEAKVLRGDFIVDGFISDKAQKLDKRGKVHYDLTDQRYKQGNELTIEAFLYDKKENFFGKYVSKKLTLDELCKAKPALVCPPAPTCPPCITPTPTYTATATPTPPYITPTGVPPTRTPGPTPTPTYTPTPKPTKTPPPTPTTPPPTPTTPPPTPTTPPPTPTTPPPTPTTPPPTPTTPPPPTPTEEPPERTPIPTVQPTPTDPPGPPPTPTEEPPERSSVYFAGETDFGMGPVLGLVSLGGATYLVYSKNRKR